MSGKAQSLSDLVVGPHHTAISCRSWEEMKSFFIDLLGFKVLGEIEARNEAPLGILAGLPGGICNWALLQYGSYHIELIKWLTPEGRSFETRQCDIGIAHVCMQVTDAEEAWRRLVAAGYKPLSPVQSLRGGTAKPFYCYGPDNVVVEFLELSNVSWNK